MDLIKEAQKRQAQQQIQEGKQIVQEGRGRAINDGKMREMVTKGQQINNGIRLKMDKHLPGSKK